MNLKDLEFKVEDFDGSVEFPNMHLTDMTYEQMRLAVMRSVVAEANRLLKERLQNAPEVYSEDDLTVWDVKKDYCAVDTHRARLVVIEEIEPIPKTKSELKKGVRIMK